MSSESPLDEIQRLRSENVTLRRRVAAFEGSRWWRLHPRMAWRQARAKLLPREPAFPSVPDRPSGAPDAIVERFRAEVALRGTFTEDWFTPVIPLWHGITTELEGRGARILEIGSFEGLSACYFLWRLPDAQLTCIDTFVGSPEHDYLELKPGRLEETFDRNVAMVDASRVRKLVGESKRVLIDLMAEGASFDLVYVDGSHAGLDVVVDAALSWQLLAEGGVLVFDDYGWDVLGANPLLRPGPAVDAFVTLVDGELEVLFRGRQLGIRKKPG